jgi:NAD-dependent deacetylase
MQDKIHEVAKLIAHSNKIVVFVGAGLSTESGIPDFRSPGGVWDKYDPEDFYFQNFISRETARENTGRWLPRCTMP